MFTNLIMSQNLLLDLPHTLLLGESGNVDMEITVNRGLSYYNVGGFSYNVRGIIKVGTYIFVSGQGIFPIYRGLNPYDIGTFGPVSDQICNDFWNDSANSVIYGAGAGNAAVYSNDGGANWSTYATMGTNARGIAANGNIIITALAANGVYISTDTGANATNYTTSNGLPSNNCTDCFIIGNDIWISTDSGMVKTSNNGSSWTSYTTTNGLRANNCTYIAYDNYRGRIYITHSDGTNGGLSWSDNGGSSWKNCSIANTNEWNMCQFLDGYIYLVGNGAFAWSKTGAHNFYSYNNMGNSTNIIGLFAYRP